MSITLTVNYKEVLQEKTVEKIDELLEDNYALDDILQFIDEHNENDFVQFYDEYVDMGEKVGYDVVDEFINYHGDVSYVEHVEDAYAGTYGSPEEFTEEFVNDVYGEVPVYLVVDWEATWKSSLSYDYDFVNGYVFRRDF